MNKQVALIAVAVVLTLAVAVIATVTPNAAYAIRRMNDWGVAHGPSNSGTGTALDNFNNQQCRSC
jgi:hypothetical protein